MSLYGLNSFGYLLVTIVTIDNIVAMSTSLGKKIKTILQHHGFWIFKHCHGIKELVRMLLNNCAYSALHRHIFYILSCYSRHLFIYNIHKWWNFDTWTKLLYLIYLINLEKRTGHKAVGAILNHPFVFISWEFRPNFLRLQSGGEVQKNFHLLSKHNSSIYLFLINIFILLTMKIIIFLLLIGVLFFL